MRRNFFGLARTSLTSRLISRVRAVERIVELRVDEKLPDRSLARIHLIDGRIDLLRDEIQLGVDLIVGQQLSGSAFSGIEVIDHLFGLGDGRPGLS